MGRRIFFFVFLCFACFFLHRVSSSPPDGLDMVLKAPIERWDEAVPLGNGIIGGLVWGKDNLIRVSLDRGDLWDLRVPEVVRSKDWSWKKIKELVEKRDQKTLVKLFDKPYRVKYPTKLPGGRLEILLPEGEKALNFRLSISKAYAEVKYASGIKARCFISSRRPLGVLKIEGSTEVSFRLVPPRAVKWLGYPPAEIGEEGNLKWYLQKCALGLRYSAVAGMKRKDGNTIIVFTLTSSRDGKDPLALGKRIVLEGLEKGFDALFSEHLEYWNDFWKRSSVRISDKKLLRHYYLVQYFYGAASRPGYPPMPLQGLWTADSGSLPPWKGDYHNDLNTQMTYAAYQEAGHFEEGYAFLDFLWKLLPGFRAFARRFYGTAGAAVPGVMALDGSPMGGWCMYSLSPTNGAWIGYLFYQHWLYTMDRKFLEERAYPWCREIGTCLKELLEPGNDGILRLPLSSSPEIHDNSLRAWLKPNSNYDHDCMKALFHGLAEMAVELGKEKEAKAWKSLVLGLGPRAVDPETHELLVTEGERLTFSHRHFSHTMSIFPFGDLNIDGGDEARKIIDATLRTFDMLGTAYWCGYSFSWMSCLRARVGRPEEALKFLDIYLKAFTLRNGFHANGDQLKAGFSSFTYRPFTLEGNFLAAQALHEMLLQSWNRTIRIFPAMPWKWHDAEFHDLRAEGGFRVSAKRKNNSTSWIRIIAESGGLLRLRDNFNGVKPRFNRKDVKKSGRDFLVYMKKGEVLEATLPVPVSPPPPPGNAWKELKIHKYIRPNRLPLRIGADSNGQNRFLGDMARASVFKRVLSGKEIRDLYKGKKPWSFEDCVVSLDFDERKGDCFLTRGILKAKAIIVGKIEVFDTGIENLGKAVRFDGKGYINMAHDPVLNCLDGLTLEAWIRPAKLPGGGGRIIDKSPAGGTGAYLFDTYPGNSLRVITRDPWVGFDAGLEPGKWVHVAATVDAGTGKTIIYVNGKPVHSNF